MDQLTEIFDSLNAPTVPVEVRIKLQTLVLLSYADLGCLLTTIEEEYEYFFHEVFNPGRFGFKSWSDLVNTVPELSIKSLKGHRVLVSEPLGRQAVTSLLTKAFFQDYQHKHNVNPAQENVSTNEASTQTDSLPPILIVKQEPVVKVEAPDTFDSDVNTDPDQETCQINATEQFSTNPVPTASISAVQNNVLNMVAGTIERPKNSKNLPLSHCKLNQDCQKGPSFGSIKNLTFDDFASLARKNTENKPFPTFSVPAVSTTTKKRQSRAKGKVDDKQRPVAVDVSEPSIGPVSGMKRPRTTGTSEAEGQRTDMTALVEFLRSALDVGSKRVKRSTDSNPFAEGVAGGYFNDNRVEQQEQVGYYSVRNQSRQTARSTGPSTNSRFRNRRPQYARKVTGD